MDVQGNTERPPQQRRSISDREAAMEQIHAARVADFTKETGIEIVDTPAVIDPDIDPEAAQAEAERARLAAAAADHDASSVAATPEDAEQLALQQQQRDAESSAAREAEEAAQRAAQQATQRAATGTGIAPDTKVTVKVNGHDVEMTWEQAQRRLQKDVAADERLEEASRTLREAQELQRQLQQQQQPAKAPAAAPAPEVVLDPKVTKKFTSALFAGDEETAAQAFTEAVSSAVAAATVETRGRGDATPVDPVAIAAQVKQQIDIDSALARSRSDYPQLYADPDIEAVAATKIHRQVQSGKPFVEALNEVQSELATKFGWTPTASRTPAASPAPNRRQEKLDRKSQLDDVSSGANVKSGTQEDAEPSVHDTIKEMAKQRGQVV